MRRRRRGGAMNKDRKSWSGAREVAKRVTPYFLLKHFTLETVGSLRRTSATLGKVLSPSPRDVNDGHASGNPSERFEALYARNGWDEESLVIHLGRVRVAKFVLLALAAAMIPAMGYTLVYVPWWIGTLLLPSFLFAMVFFSAQALRHAWWCWQISNRSLSSPRAFIDSKDLWSYLFF